MNARSHEVVLDIIRQSKCRAFCVRIDQHSTVEAVAKLVADQLILLVPHSNQKEPSRVINTCSGEATVPAQAASDRDVAASLPCDTIDKDVRQGLISKINEGLVGLKVHESESLVTNCDEVRADLSQ